MITLSVWGVRRPPVITMRIRTNGEGTRGHAASTPRSWKLVSFRVSNAPLIVANLQGLVQDSENSAHHEYRENQYHHNSSPPLCL